MVVSNLTEHPLWLTHRVVILIVVVLPTFHEHRYRLSHHYLIA